jgi:Protein of unknown function (DUF3563)
MRVQNPTVSDPGFITMCIQLAQSTFSDVMPAKSDPKPLAQSRRSPAPAAQRGIMAAIDDWFYRQQVNAREAYLAQSTDIFDLESRIRHLERRPYY